MFAAIYARKSTEQTGVAHEAKSVARQVEHARAYAQKKGWVVADEHIYVDDGISGAEFAKRPGFVRLLNALAHRPPFQVLVMSEESRLGREMAETMGALKHLVTSGVRVFYYLDKERTLDSPIEKAMMALETFGAELEREKARQWSRDAARHKAAHGYVAGGRCFGYRNVRTAAGHVVREVDPEEAAIVVRIFEMCRDGKGAARICQALNTEGARAPRAQQGRPKGWVPSSIRAVLHRTAYRGELLWGVGQKRDGWGQTKYSRRPETEWLRTRADHLRLVSDELWQAAHERLATSRQNYLRHTDGKLWGKPANGVESKYLLTGMATCGACGGGMLIYPRTHGSPGHRQRVYVYACPRARVDLCANDLEVPMPVADAAALGIITDEVLAPEVVDLAIDKLMAMFDVAPDDAAARRARLTDGLRKVERELANLQAAVAAGEPMETLLAGIREREGRQRDLRLQLELLDEGPTVRAAAPQVRSEARRLLEEWVGLLGKHVATSRQLLRKMLDREHRFVFYPKREGAARWYELGVTPTLDRFLASMPMLKKAGTSPTGFEPVFWP